MIIINYNTLLDSEDIQTSLREIKNVAGLSKSDVVLKIDKNSLRVGANLEKPNLSDIKGTIQAAYIADRIIYTRSDSVTIPLKGDCLCTGFYHRNNCIKHQMPF